MAALKIHCVAKYVPEHTVTNEELAKNTGLPLDSQWIYERTGIFSRRYAKEETNVDMAVEVGKKLMQGQNASEICAVVVATFTPDAFTPSIACIVQKSLDLPKNIMAFDVNAACSGFVYGLSVAQGLLLQNPDKKVLLIGSEKISDFLNYQDQNSCILFGDGAGGVLLGLQDGQQPFVFGTDGNEDVIRCGTGMGEKLSMRGREVFSFAVNTLADCVKQLTADGDEVAHIVCHQANDRIITSVQKRLGYEDGKFFRNIKNLGNTSAASIPIALAEMDEKGMLHTGEKIVLVGFGAGLTWGGTKILW